MLRKFLRLFSRAPRSVEDILRFPDGKRIYREFHELRREAMDQDALKVINRLNRHGHRSYLVGGCVRDMLLGRRPKDFDVVTSATPAQIRKIFSNSRAIGRRFKIMHVVFQGGKVIEVSTFRSLPSHRLEPGQKDKDYMMKRDNEFGSPREDAARRDFTLNALFFDPRNESLIDYVGGFDDVKARRISVIGDPDISYKEDPVRMLRAAKFAALLEFEIDSSTFKAIRRNKGEISKASTARLLDEYAKIFRTGKSSKIFASLEDTGLFRVLFPEAWQASDAGKHKSFLDSSIGRRLVVADRLLSEREELTLDIFYALIFADVVSEVFSDRPHKNLMEYVKTRITPMCKRIQFPNADIDRLIQMFMSQGRFYQTERSRKFRPDVFREKVFFYEAFAVFKICALAQQNDDAVQKAMFWEIGPRERPPEPGKIVSVFPVHRGRYRQERRPRGGDDSRRAGQGGGRREGNRADGSGRSESRGESRSEARPGRGGRAGQAGGRGDARRDAVEGADDVLRPQAPAADAAARDGETPRVREGGRRRRGRRGRGRAAGAGTPEETRSLEGERDADENELGVERPYGAAPATAGAESASGRDGYDAYDDDPDEDQADGDERDPDDEGELDRDDVDDDEDQLDGDDSDHETDSDDEADDRAGRVSRS